MKIVLVLAAFMPGLGRTTMASQTPAEPQAVLTETVADAHLRTRQLGGQVEECVPYHKDRDCDKDDQCQGHLLCAEQHKDELERAGYNRNTAYCQGWYPDWFEVCYDPKKVHHKSSHTSHHDSYYYESSYQSRTTRDYKIEECAAYDEHNDRDCDSDDDCQGHLKCADQHMDELERAGYSRKTAYCQGYYPDWFEVCYDPNKIHHNRHYESHSSHSDYKIEECVSYDEHNDRDCDSDDDCQGHLKCADKHMDELERAGYNRKTAYCEGYYPDWFEVCYDPNKIHHDNNSHSYVRTYAASSSHQYKKLHECHYGCQDDDDCEYGYHCAKAHQHKLKKRGLDEHKAYCTYDYAIPSHSYVCFEEKKLW